MQLEDKGVRWQGNEYRQTTDKKYEADAIVNTGSPNLAMLYDCNEKGHSSYPTEKESNRMFGWCGQFLKHATYMHFRHHPVSSYRHKYRCKSR